MADFVKDAFKKAMGASAEAEFLAYMKSVVGNIDNITMTAGMMVGLDEMDKLSKTVLDAGQEDALAAFTEGLIMAAFHLGYKKGREAE